MPVINNIALPLDSGENEIRAACAKKLSVRPKDILSIEILKRSVDARNKRDVRFVYSVRARAVGEALQSAPAAETLPRVRVPHRPIVVGLGPCGLFAAWDLTRRGMEPIVLERGRDVLQRQRDVKRFSETGELNTESNIQFGEGGAGAFSDGKLTTGISDPHIETVLRQFVSCGAPEEILYEAKPHIGTDRLPYVVKTMREQIENMGGTVLFGHRLTGIITERGTVIGIEATDEEGQIRTFETRDVLLAIGHSARDTFFMLREMGLPMQAKPFSVGARIEHLQQSIDRAQYGAFAGHPRLGAADYKLSTRLKNGRGAYTFCMCPGGTVVAAASEKDMVATNGMSTYKRDGINANSALLIGVEPSDYESDDPLAGVLFQRKWESLAFHQGGGGYAAPAQRVEDLLSDRPSKACGEVVPSYAPSVRFTTLSACLPKVVYYGLAEAVRAFDAKLRGFAHPDAVLTGVETRSSSPVRLLRGENRMSALVGLYPAGEGAGYAGGIMSAAVDGLRSAESIAARYADIETERNG
ncbi:MAG: NAD(P)/FAD-dependent oxidoreductase [Christensenellales bacterium]